MHPCLHIPLRNHEQRIHALQPVQFGLYVPRRLAVARRLRNVQLFALDPGWSIRRWWVAASPPR